MDRESLKQQYRGDTAARYEDERKTSEKWNNEQRAVERYLRDIDSNVDAALEILDIPVGTGRFFDIYRELDVDVLGADVSEDMIEEARENTSEDDRIALTRGDIFQLETLDIEPDIVVCVRLMNWLELDDLTDAIRNMADTDTEFAIVSVRTYAPAGSTDGSSRPVSLGREAIRVLRTEGPRALIDSTVSFVRNRTSSEPSITVHHREDLIAVIEDAGFDVADRELVDEGAGTEYHIYLLESTET